MAGKLVKSDDYGSKLLSIARYFDTLYWVYWSIRSGRDSADGEQSKVNGVLDGWCLATNSQRGKYDRKRQFNFHVWDCQLTPLFTGPRRTTFLCNSRAARGSGRLEDTRSG